MTEYKQNFKVTQGDTKEITIPIIDENGDPKTITGAAKRWEAYDRDGTTLVVQKADGDISIVSISPNTDNAIRFTLTPGDTVNLAADSYNHEAQVVDASSNVSTVTKGRMEVEAQLVK